MDEPELPQHGSPDHDPDHDTDELPSIDGAVEDDDSSASSSARRLPMLEESLRVPPDYTPCKRADVLELDMGDGVILYDNESSLVHHLNPSAALIWHMCDGSGAVSDLACDISEEYALELGTVHNQVMTTIAEFDALGLVLDAREQVEPESADDLRPES